jgi:hypothetical protein
MNDDFGEIFGTKTMTWIDDLDVERNFYVDIGVPTEKPVPGHSHTVWDCKVRTRDSGEDSVMKVTGADKIQAIYLALVMAGIMTSELTIAPACDYAEIPHFGFAAPPQINNGP